MKRRLQLDISGAEFYMRDEENTGRRLVADVDEDLLGAAKTVFETDREWLTIDLELYELEALAALASVAGRATRAVPVVRLARYGGRRRRAGFLQPNTC